MRPGNLTAASIHFSQHRHLRVTTEGYTIMLAIDKTVERREHSCDRSVLTVLENLEHAPTSFTFDQTKCTPMGIIQRTTDNAGRGNSRPAGSDTSASTQSSTNRIVLPIVLILAILIFVSLFALYCRRVLRRSELGQRPMRLDTSGRQARPELWDVQLGRPEDRNIPLSAIQARFPVKGLVLNDVANQLIF